MENEGQALVEYTLLAAVLIVGASLLSRALEAEIPNRMRILLNLTALYFPW